MDVLLVLLLKRIEWALVYVLVLIEITPDRAHLVVKVPNTRTHSCSHTVNSELEDRAFPTK